MPKISILTPAYIDTEDKVRWLREAVESVQAQDFTDWEMIIVDDSSPLGLGIPADDRVKQVRTAHQSYTSLCRNTAAALAQGEAILALDADDTLPADALTTLYQSWSADKKRVVYGDLQRLTLSKEGHWRLERVVNFPDYDFTRSLDFRGTIHVSAMHSKEAHVRAGGWKPELEAGLEDVEYWISCGLAGFCGYHLNAVTLNYRRHDKSRTRAMRNVTRREGEMRSIMYQMHEDIYEGRNYPMACCGGRGGGTRANRVAGSQAAAQSNPRATTLSQYPGDVKVWVEYKALRTASFGIKGPYTGFSYQVQGTGHKMEVHNQDLSIFRRCGKGKDFLVGVAPPIGEASPVAPVEEQPGTEYTPPAPEVTTIERLPESVAPPPQPAPVPEPVAEPVQSYALGLLNLDKTLENKLEAAGWDIMKLTQSDDVAELTKIRGIGPVRAAQIIGRARDYLEAHGG